MKIVFTQFTPPFEHGMTEVEYLKYDDWYSKIRRAFAKTEEVVFVSLTKKKELIKIKHDGYIAMFFPVKNPKEKQSHGRLWYQNDELCPWLLEYNPDVIHIVGTGSQMGLNILQTVREPLLFLWERCAVNKNTLKWEELDLCDYYVHPTFESIERAAIKVSKNKLLKVPLGADTDSFKPHKIKKQFDIVTVGRLTPSKQIDKVQSIVNKKCYSWIHAGGFVKKAPYTKIEDLLFFLKSRSLFSRYSIKKSFSGRIYSGIFSHNEMPKIYNIAKIMVHPSLHEGAARSVQEALSCQVPVIVLKSAVSWIEPEFGMVIEDISQLDDAIHNLLSNLEKAKRMGRNGREWLLANHSFSHLYGFLVKFHQMKKPLQYF